LLIGVFSTYLNAQCPQTISITGGDLDGDPCNIEIDIEITGAPPPPGIGVAGFFIDLAVSGPNDLFQQGGAGTFDGNSLVYECLFSGCILGNNLVARLVAPLEPGECITIGESLSSPNGILFSLNPFISCNFEIPETTICNDIATTEVCGVIQNGNNNCTTTDDSGVSGVEVTIIDDCGNEVTAVTGEDGTYCVDISTVSCIIPEVNPADCPECDTAITEADCALIDQIRNLVTGRPHNLTPAQVLAADVNGSGTINTLDVIIMQIYCFYDPEVLSDATLEAIGTCQYIPSSKATGELECFNPELCPPTCGETDFTLIFAGDINGSCSSCEVDPEINPFPREFVLSDNSFAFSIACNTSLALEDFYFLFEKNSNDDPISYELNSRINEAVQLEIVEYDKYFAITGILS